MNSFLLLCLDARATNDCGPVIPIDTDLVHKLLSGHRGNFVTHRAVLVDDLWIFEQTRHGVRQFLESSRWRVPWREQACPARGIEADVAQFFQRRCVRSQGRALNAADGEHTDLPAGQMCLESDEIQESRRHLPAQQGLCRGSGALKLMIRQKFSPAEAGLDLSFEPQTCRLWWGFPAWDGNAPRQARVRSGHGSPECARSGQSPASACSAGDHEG